MCENSYRTHKDCANQEIDNKMIKADWAIQNKKYFIIRTRNYSL